MGSLESPSGEGVKGERGQYYQSLPVVGLPEVFREISTHNIFPVSDINAPWAGFRRCGQDLRCTGVLGIHSVLMAAGRRAVSTR